MAVKQFKKAISWFNGRNHNTTNPPFSPNNFNEDLQIEIPGGLEGIRQRMAAMGHVPIGTDFRPQQVIRQDEHTPQYGLNSRHQNSESNQMQSPPKPRRRPVKKDPTVSNNQKEASTVEGALEGGKGKF
jgi:hypothetical protein